MLIRRKAFQKTKTRRVIGLTLFCLSFYSVGIIIQKVPGWPSFLYIPEICYLRAADGISVCRPDCSRLQKHFSLPGMKSCRPWLTCDDEVITKQVISNGFVKQVYKAKWQNFTVAKNVLFTPKHRLLFQKNIGRMRSLNPSRYVTQLIGICNDTFITEFQPYGTADRFKKVIKSLKPKFSSIRQRFLTCINYVEIIDFLHHSPLGVLMMCDSNSVGKSLSQFLLTEDLRLILNDLDCVPKVDPINGTVCNKDRHIEGTLLAPEQKWPFENIKKFNWKLMPPYNEKVDIWRIPEICQYLLGDNGTESINTFLSNIHTQCKRINPSERPTTEQILDKYYKALKQCI